MRLSDARQDYDDLFSNCSSLDYACATVVAKPTGRRFVGRSRIDDAAGGSFGGSRAGGTETDSGASSAARSSDHAGQGASEPWQGYDGCGDKVDGTGSTPDNHR